MNDSPALSLVTDDFDDTCSCGSIYHSLTNTPVDVFIPTLPALGFESLSTPIDSYPNTPSISELDLQSLKDQRSHERARQRLKKPDDKRKSKRTICCRVCQKPAGNGGRPKQISRNLRVSFTEAESERRLGWGDSMELEEEHPGVAVPPSARIVTLADLVKPQRKRSDKQFEIVGRPRQVLVMDEFTEVDSKFDLEDWEYVEAEVKHRKNFKAPTYARVVARA